MTYKYNIYKYYLLVLYFLVWTTQLTLQANSLPMDNIEQWVWSHSLEWGYYKHPPLPTWLLAAALRLGGPIGVTGVVLGAMCTLGAMFVFSNLIGKIQGSQSAFIALMAVMSITFYSNRLYYYNHNVLLMLWVACSALCWWNIVETRQLRWWLGLGISAGLGMLSKYQYVLVLIPSAWLISRLKPWQSHRQMIGLTCAILMAGLIFLPHAIWLVHQDVRWSPIQYAMQTSWPVFLDKSKLLWQLKSGIWLVDLVFNRCLPALFLLLWLHWVSQPIKQLPVITSQMPPVTGESFLLWWGVSPILCITLMGLALGMDLQMQWGTAFALWMIPVFSQMLGLQQRSIGVRQVRSAIAIFALIQGVLMLYSYQTSTYGCCSKHNYWRMFNSQKLAKELDMAARDAIGGKFTIIVGQTSAAGAVALALPDHPKVLIDNNLGISPWIDRNELDQPGVIELWPPGVGPDDIQRLRSAWGWRPYVQPSPVSR